MSDSLGTFLAEQYRDASNLGTRIHLHERFSINHYGWYEWVFDQLRLPPHSRVLELGCGAGIFWLRNLARIPDSWEVTLTDVSPGMLNEARRNLQSAGRPFEYAVVDAQSIPYEDAALDAVVANHMLYHVPDRPKALGEIRRVLRPGGRLYASTAGATHMRELHDLVDGFVAKPVYRESFSSTFTLENGLDQISPWFPNVRLRRYDDALLVTEAELLVAYAVSGVAKSFLVGDRLASFARFIEEQLALHGAIRISKDSGIFEAWLDG